MYYQPPTKLKNEESKTHIDMCRHITLDTGISLDEPRAANISSCLKNGMFHHFLKLRGAVLKLVGEHEARKPRPNGNHSDFATRCPSRDISQFFQRRK